jgi:hypothetical protein
MKKRLALCLSTVLVTVAGCAAVDANVNHGDLAVTTHLSETVFLDPVPANKKTIWVTARNTSDHPELDIKANMVQAIAARGYTIVQDPDQAQFLLRVNVLQAGEVQPESRASMLAASYGEPLVGGALAAGATSALGGGGGATAGVGLGVAAATFIANQAYKVKNYTVVTDIQLSSRPLSGKKVDQSTRSVAAQANASAKVQSTGRPTGAANQAGLATGTATYNGRSVEQHIDEQSDFKQYQIRAIAYCDQVNLKFETAEPLLQTRLSSALANLFE